MGSQTPEEEQVTSHLECFSSKPASRISLPDTMGFCQIPRIARQIQTPWSRRQHQQKNASVPAASLTAQRNSDKNGGNHGQACCPSWMSTRHPKTKIFLCILSRILYIKPSGMIYMNSNNNQFGRRSERRSFPFRGHLCGPWLQHRTAAAFGRAGHGRMASGTCRHREGKE